MRCKKYAFLCALFCLTSFFCLAAIPSRAAESVRQSLAAESMINQVLERKTLRVGFSTFVPWAMQDKDGEFIGFEVDVATRLAADMGVAVEFVPTSWDGIIAALLTGQFDIIIGGMSMQPGRALKVNFSTPYDYAGMDIVANKQKAAGFTRVEDFNKPEVIIALRSGATSAAAVKKYMPLAQVRAFNEEAQAVQEVITGRAHAMVSSTPLPATQAFKHQETLFTPLSEPFTKEPVGLAVRKGDPDTLTFLNTWIQIVSDEGWLSERQQYWFKTDAWEKLLK